MIGGKVEKYVLCRLLYAKREGASMEQYSLDALYS